MSKVILRKNNKIRRKLRTRKKIFGTSDRPRLSVFRSLRYIDCQLIDDNNGVTLEATSSVTKKLHEKKSKSEAAFEVGKEIAKGAIKKGIKSVVFDKGPYKYHGRVKNLADGAREGGLEF